MICREWYHVKGAAKNVGIRLAMARPKSESAPPGGPGGALLSRERGYFPPPLKATERIS